MANGGFANAPPGDEYNQKLQQLVERAQRHPPETVERQIALSKLLNEVVCCRCLARPQQGLWHSSVYEDFYNEALQRTLMEICQKIDKYNPKSPVMAWVNFLLKKRFLDVVRDDRCRGMTQIPQSQEQQGINFVPTLEELDCYLSDKAPSSDAEQLWQFLQDDPEGLLQQAKISKNPYPTFQFLAWARYVEDRTWEDISVQTKLSMQTLCSFFNRQLRKLRPYFEKYLRS